MAVLGGKFAHTAVFYDLGVIMLTYVIGLAGSGKTTLCAKYAYIFLKKNKNVYCNVPILGTKILDCNTDLGQVAMSNGIVLIDEAAIEFNSREYAKLSKYVNDFIRTHRHANLDVYAFSQNYMGADKLFRDNCEQLIYLRKSRIPRFSLMRVYLHEIVPPNGVNLEFADKYSLMFSKTRLIRFGSFSNMFDSYELPVLPEKDWQVWEFKNRYSENVEKPRKQPKIVERLTYFFSKVLCAAGASVRPLGAIFSMNLKSFLQKAKRPGSQKNPLNGSRLWTKAKNFETQKSLTTNETQSIEHTTIENTQNTPPSIVQNQQALPLLFE